jgi:hypothetical protein
MGKPADQSVGFVYPSGGGNDIGVYKQPMNIDVQADVHTKEGNKMNESRISIGNITKSYPQDDPYGKKEMRGYGAATKGRKISGKQG